MARDDGDPPRRLIHGRRRGHRLRPGRVALRNEILPKLAVPEAEPSSLVPASLFDRPVDSVWLEIGFGAGEHLVWQAQRNPTIGFIGVEPFINGVARLLAEVDRLALDNVRIHEGDARDLVEWLAPASIDRAFVLFPDPWPKARHHKRRLINDEMTAALARVMVPGAILRIASDIPDYQRWIVEHVRRQGSFEWLARRAADWRERPADWPQTRYEEKALREGRKPVFLSFARR